MHITVINDIKCRISWRVLIIFKKIWNSTDFEAYDDLWKYEAIILIYSLKLNPAPVYWGVFW